MAIIELAHISLKNGLTASDALLKKNTKEVKRVIEEYSHLPTLFYTQIDEPSTMFVVGAWESTDKHQNGFNGSLQQDQILQLIKDQMEIDWMYYMDVDQSRIPVDAPILSIIKETLPKNTNKAAFDQDFARGTQSLGGARYGAVSAWNIRKDKHEETVRVNFSGWQSLEEAMEAIGNTIENAKKFRVTPMDLNFFFLERMQLE
ncbi:hypothetical protein A1O1_01792 [Capronia coronata CBS 617.96]|uniref:ABM domain-containing protein n=1 Tax=Capronia coronata CBS 617.96 TaxID=1182541 RepID=W9YUQ9_9EURO|nr:uncharacterized protein A1O1_01792 [Capronia coronata CBS 617.96]EXJ93400.1 hypothetical protein A1O1_01792 [Capronia coronata CBS 617.96]